MEGSLFSSGTISVTQTMAVFGNTSYPIANVGAVSIEQSQSPLFRLGFVLLGGGAISWMFGSGINGTVIAAIGAVLIWYFSDKGKAKLMLRTSSGNQQAFESSDSGQVKQIKSAIEQAIAMRG